MTKELKELNKRLDDITKEMILFERELNKFRTEFTRVLFKLDELTKNETN